jgi:homoserine O-acetyltransferase
MVGPGQADRHRPLVRGLRELVRQLQGLDRPGVDRSPPPARPTARRSPTCRSRTAPTPAFACVASLGIDRLACVIGNSMGGMTALRTCCATRARRARTSTSPARRARCRSRSRSARCSARRSASIPTGRTASYDADHYPENGMRMARKLGVVTYRSAIEWDGASAACASRTRRGRATSASAWSSRSSATSRARAPLRAPVRPELLPLPQPLDGLVRPAAEYDPRAGRRRSWPALASIRLEKALAIGVHTDNPVPLRSSSSQIADWPGSPAAAAVGVSVPLESRRAHDVVPGGLARLGAIPRLLAKL